MSQEIKQGCIPKPVSDLNNILHRTPWKEREFFTFIWSCFLHCQMIHFGIPVAVPVNTFLFPNLSGLYMGLSAKSGSLL